MQKEIQHLDEVTAIVPWYDEHGSVTRVFTYGHEEQRVPLQPLTVMQRLAGRYGKSLPLLRRLAFAETRLQRTGILVISPSIVLMPWKVRRPRVLRDGAMGFLNIAYPFTLSQERPGSLCIRLAGQEPLPVLWSRETFLQHHALASHLFLAEHTRTQYDLSRCRVHYLDLLQRRH